MTCVCVCASSEKSQFEFSMYQKVNDRVELGVLSTWSAKCDVLAGGTFALAAKYQPSSDSSVKVSLSAHLYSGASLPLLPGGRAQLAPSEK